jgi:putative ABC transport system permease protein
MIKKINQLIKPRWRKVFTDLWENKLRTLLVIASIAVGVFAVGTIITTYVLLSEDIGITYSSKNPANIRIGTDPFYENIVSSVEHVSGVQEAEGRRVEEVRISDKGEVWKNIKLIGISDYSDSNINVLSTIDGKKVPDRKEIILSDDYLNQTGFSIGDELIVEFPDGSTHNLILVGLVSDQSTNGADFLGGAIGYVTLDTIDWMGFGDYFNQMYVVVSEGSNEISTIEEISSILEDKLERSNLSIYWTDNQVSNEHPMESIVLALLGVMVALGVLTLLLSSSLIVNTLNALIGQHLRQIGVMKLIGGRSIQILGMYLVLILSYGLAALIVALPISGISGYALAQYICSFINADLLGFRVIPLAVVLQITIALLIPIAAGFVPLNKGSKTNVRKAINSTNSAGRPAQVGWLDRISEWIQWLSRPILLSIRNTFRRKSRLVLTIFTLTTAGAIFIAVFNVRSSMNDFMKQIEQYFKADITLGFSQPYPITSIENSLSSIPGIDHLEGWGAAGIDIIDEDDNVVENVYIMAPPAGSELVDPDIITGRWTLPGERKALVVSDMIYDYFPDIQPGDQIQVLTTKDVEEYWTVVGVFRFTAAMDEILAYADYDFISDMLGIPNKAMTYRIVTSDHSLQEQERIGAQVDEYLRDRDYLVNEVEAGSYTQGQSGKALNILIVFLFVMALLTAFVGSIGLTGTMGMNVLERTREIGVMRAIGAVDGEIIKSVIIEGGFIGFITWFLAVFLSFPISDVLLKIISEAMLGSRMRLTFTFQGFVIWLFVVLVLSMIASIVPARNAANLTIREVLAYE